MVTCFLHCSIITIWYLDQSFRTTSNGFCRFLVLDSEERFWWSGANFSHQRVSFFASSHHLLPFASRLQLKEMVHWGPEWFLFKIFWKRNITWGWQFSKLICFLVILQACNFWFSVWQRAEVWYLEMGLKLDSDVRYRVCITGHSVTFVKNVTQTYRVFQKEW